MEKYLPYRTKIWVKSYEYSNHQKNTFMGLILQIRHASNNEWIIGNQNNIWLDNWESNNIWLDNWISFNRMNERFIRISRKGMVKKCLAEWKDSDQTKVNRRYLISPVDKDTAREWYSCLCTSSLKEKKIDQETKTTIRKMLSAWYSSN